MISNDVFTKEWVVNKSKNLRLGKRQASPELIEKVTKAFHLLESLVHSQLKFIFKGGTSLMLIDSPQRFSIDIDIIIHNITMDINDIFKGIIAESEIFIRYEEDERKNIMHIPKQHFKFYYNSCLNGKEGYILLDILYEDVHFSEVIERDIICDFIDCSMPIERVRVPSIDCVLGDKLTAFAPNTTGIQYGIGIEQEIIKQLFDVGNLFDLSTNLEMVRQTFINSANQELQYRKRSDLNYHDVLNDIIDTAFTISFRNKKMNHFNELEKGIQMIRDFIFTQKYNIEEAVVSASKAAYLAMHLKSEMKSIEFFVDTMELKDMKITHPEYKKLNSIKTFSPKGFYYWYKTVEMIDTHYGHSSIHKSFKNNHSSLPM